MASGPRNRSSFAPSRELFAKSCVQCHANDPKELGVRDAVATLIRDSRRDYDRAETRVHEATVRGLATDDEQLLLQEANTQVTQLEALQHTLALDQLKPVAAQSAEIVKLTQSNIAGLEQVERWKRLALTPIWIFLALMGVLFWLKRQQIEKRGGR